MSVSTAEKIAAVEWTISMQGTVALFRPALQAVLADLRAMRPCHWDHGECPLCRRAGAEEMRERAAKVVAASAHNWDIARSAPERLAAAIRALPVEDT